MNSDEKLSRQSMLEHKQRHKELHEALDELVADFIIHTGKFPSCTTMLELMQWSAKQKEDPEVPNTRSKS